MRPPHPELEFDEAQRRNRPILLFIMSGKHPLCEADVELDPDKRTSWMPSASGAKQMKPGTSVHRVYATFDSLEDFTAKAIQSVADPRRHLEPHAPPPEPATTEFDPIPARPAFQRLSGVRIADMPSQIL
jgi:hypothetical protein